MLSDIVSLTNIVADNLNNENPKLVFKVYESLKEVIEKTDETANHYLVLDFSEEFLQNSSFGTPEMKWRYFLNEDLKSLNKSVKNYLLLLPHLCKNNKSIIGFAKPLSYASFVRDEYNVGFVEPCGMNLIIEQLNLKAKDEYCLAEFKKIDLSTFTKRKDLMIHLEIQKETLNSGLEKIKDFILENVTVEDLV
jgi:hypothetical protein